MNYKIIDMDKYYRRDVFRHFSQDCKCSISMTSRLDVTKLENYSRSTGTKFYINFLYMLAKALNSREDYRMGYLWQTQQIIVYDKINPAQYIFHEDVESCTPVYTEYHNNYDRFYSECEKDIVKAKQSQKYALDMGNHPNWFDASYISWLSYDSLHVELPDGYLYFMPIVNWGRYHKENGRLIMPVSVRLNHAAADGYLLAKVFLLLQEKIVEFTRE
ncbi:CatA-like O-acetyltransferase, family 3 [Pectinatus frisingensis]|uniref:CatA-like O-acetyltransferase, family 3 n=1 Tax=Pectinatus frisingensis TaxID=865 RepID=UPI0018C4BA96|nr:CatA-like O-acetyltransferase, family 3 [Pectinatus frisingensis]